MTRVKKKPAGASGRPFKIDQPGGRISKKNRPTGPKIQVPSPLETKPPAIEQPGAGDKLAGTRDVRGEPVKASSTRSHPNTIAAKAYLPFGRYKVDARLLVEVLHA